VTPKADQFTTLKAACQDPALSHAEFRAFVAVWLCADSRTGSLPPDKRGGLERILERSHCNYVQRLAELLAKAHELGYMTTRQRGARRHAERWVIFRPEQVSR
jgi:hypothetical protein